MFDVHDQRVVTSAGVQVEKVSVPRGRSYFVKGPAHERDKAAGYPIVGGYGITRGIPKAFWEEFCEQNKGALMLEGANGGDPVLFACDKPRDATARAKELSGVRSGMEPINIGGDQRAAPPRKEITAPEPDPDGGNEFFFDEASS